MHFMIYSQHRLAAEVQRQESMQNPSHTMDHIMQSGFTMSDIKGLHRFGEDGVEADELCLNPGRPARKGSVGRGSPYDDMMRSTSALDIDTFQIDGEDKVEKKRGRSPFKFFKKSRDHSKDKHKSKSPPDRNRGRGTCNIIFFLLIWFLFVIECALLLKTTKNF